MANIIPGSPIVLEEMPPTDGLLAGIVCLSPALVGSLKDTVVAHVVGNMEDEALNIYLEGVDITQYFPPKNQLFSGCPSRRLKRQHCGPKQDSGKEHETGGKGARHKF